MPEKDEETRVSFDSKEEVERFFDDSSYADDEPPRFVLILGPTGVGKSRLRKERYATGYVLLDAGDFHQPKPRRVPPFW